MRKSMLYAAVLVPSTLCAGVLAEAQSTGTFRAERQPFHLVRSTDPEFQSLVQAHMPEVLAAPQFGNVRKSVALIVNDSSSVLVAASIKWVVIGTSGKQDTFFSDILFPPFPKVPLPGYRAVLFPNQIALVTPFGFYRQQSTAQTGAASLSALMQAYTQTPAAASVLASSTITATIDSAIFRSQVIVGRDESRLGRRYACSRNTAISEARSLIPLLNAPTQLAAKIAADRATPASGDDSSCEVELKVAADRIASCFSSQQPGTFARTLGMIAAAPPVTLRRLPRPTQTSSSL